MSPWLSDKFARDCRALMTAPLNDLIDARARHAERAGQAIDRHAERLQVLAPQNAARMNRGRARPVCEGGATRRMGCGPPLRRQTACTNITANLRLKRPAFHTPSVAFGDTFPASRRRVRLAGACRLDDLRERPPRKPRASRLAQGRSRLTRGSPFPCPTFTSSRSPRRSRSGCRHGRRRWRATSPTPTPPANSRSALSTTSTRTRPRLRSPASPSRSRWRLGQAACAFGRRSVANRGQERYQDPESCQNSRGNGRLARAMAERPSRSAHSACPVWRVAYRAIGRVKRKAGKSADDGEKQQQLCHWHPLPISNSPPMNYTRFEALLIARLRRSPSQQK